MSKLAVLLLIALLTPLQPLYSQGVLSSPFIEGIIQKIDARQNQWSGIRADLTLYFDSPEQHEASCRGVLTYRRLDEKMLLSCFRTDGRLVFAFKTSDTRFELFLAAQNTLFSGSIFDLNEDAGIVNARLKPLDLYRALKPMAVQTKQSSVEDISADGVTLQVFGNKHQTPYLARRMLVSALGDIIQETYYSFEENPLTTIHRKSFREYRLADDRRIKNVPYPHEIIIESHTISKFVTLRFDNVRLFSFLDEENWNIPVKGTVNFISLDE